MAVAKSATRNFHIWAFSSIIRSQHNSPFIVVARMTFWSALLLERLSYILILLFQLLIKTMMTQKKCFIRGIRSRPTTPQRQIQERQPFRTSGLVNPEEAYKFLNITVNWLDGSLQFRLACATLKLLRQANALHDWCKESGTPWRNTSPRVILVVGNTYL
jgi:hypothetical protein